MVQLIAISSFAIIFSGDPPAAISAAVCSYKPSEKQGSVSLEVEGFIAQGKFIIVTLRVGGLGLDLGGLGYKYVIVSIY